MSELDDPGLRAAMRAYLDAADRLDDADPDVDGHGARVVLDLAQAKSLTAMMLHRRLRDLGWTPPPRSAGQGLGVVHRTEG